jgi:hypothetical protein
VAYIGKQRGSSAAIDMLRASPSDDILGGHPPTPFSVKTSARILSFV